jgi:hypothetical protein
MDNILQLGASEHTRLEMKSPFSRFDISSNGSWANLSRSEWLRQVRARLRALADLPAGWDGYGAPKVAVDTVLFTQQILMDIWTPRLSAPEISAMSSGSLMAEFHDNGFELTVEVAGPYKAVFCLERPDGQESAGAIGADMSELRAIIAEMVAANNVFVLVA